MPVPETAFRTYLRRLEEHRRGTFPRATEHTYRPALISLLEDHWPDARITNEGARIVNCGAPDITVTRSGLPVGHIETKDIRDQLNRTECTEQLRTYLSALPNLILTDYLEFRWYVGGVRQLSVRLGEVTEANAIRPVAGGIVQLNQLLDFFFTQQPNIIVEPRDLAQRMAANGQLIKRAVVSALVGDDTGPLAQQLTAFRRVFEPDLTVAKFADMYAQTLVYGLFAARFYHRAGEPFSRASALLEVPRSNPFLRRFFGTIGGAELDERVAWSVDNLAALLDRVDIEQIRTSFGKLTGRQDPVLHFYETFLASYDPSVIAHPGAVIGPLYSASRMAFRTALPLSLAVLTTERQAA